MNVRVGRKEQSLRIILLPTNHLCNCYNTIDAKPANLKPKNGWSHQDAEGQTESYQNRTLLNLIDPGKQKKS